MSKIKVYKTHYIETGRTWCTVSKPFKNNSEVGHCFDFLAEDLDDMEQAIKQLKSMKAEVVEPDLEQQDHDKAIDKKRDTWYYKVWGKYFENVGFQCTPFDWEFTLNKSAIMFKWLSHGTGISIGPFKIFIPNPKKDEEGL